MKHPTLARLPYEVLSNPSVAGIQKALGKRKRIFRILHYLFLILFAWEAVNVLFLDKPNSIEGGAFPIFYVLDIFMLVLFPVAAFLVHRQTKRFDIFDEEIRNLIDEHCANGG